MLFSNSSKHDKSKHVLNLDLISNNIEFVLQSKLEYSSSISNKDFEGLLKSSLNSLKKEVFNPGLLKKVIFNSENNVIREEEIKQFLFSILTEKKLNVIRNFLKNRETILSRKQYKIDILLHVYIQNSNNKSGDKSLIINRIKNENCNLNLKDVIERIEKSFGYVFENGISQLKMESIVIQLELLRNEIFHSNSTQIFAHKPPDNEDVTDEEVKDYIYSELKEEHKKFLNGWIIDNGNLFIELSVGIKNVGLITSIYVPDL